MKWLDFNSEKVLLDTLLGNIESSINNDIALKGEASILLSGGSTPLALYERFKELAIKWGKVKIGLVDDRYVPVTDKDSNYCNIKKSLGEDIVSKAFFSPLVVNLTNENQNLLLSNKANADFLNAKTLVLLGMGTDGHTASLFPNTASLLEGLQNKKPQLLISSAPFNPIKRITHNRTSILLANHLILYIKGVEKKRVFDNAHNLKTPISLFTNQKNPVLNIYWTK
jgi:6-phosphogluconolactonase